MKDNLGSCKMSLSTSCKLNNKPDYDLTPSRLAYIFPAPRRIIGSSGNTCSSSVTSLYKLSHRSFSGSGVSHANSGSLNQSLSKCLLSPSQHEPFVLVGMTYSFPGESVKASLAWKMLKLLTYWISPFWKSKVKLKRSARKCNASSASAWASVIGGMLLLRGRLRKPVKPRRAYWMMTLSGDVSLAGVWKSRGREVYGFRGSP